VSHSQVTQRTVLVLKNQRKLCMYRVRVRMLLLLLLPGLYKVYHNRCKLTTESSRIEMFDHIVLEQVDKN